VRVLVTGATGFLGTRLVPILQAQGHTVRALVRETSDVRALKAAGAELVVGSLHPPQRLETACEAVDAIVHCAGGGKVRDVSAFYANNLATTTNLLEAARATCPNLRRFVFVSSLSAHGPSPDGVPRDPAEATTPITHYGRAKAQAETAVLDAADAFDVTILRPPAIYGPGDTRMLPVFKAAARGLLPLPGPARMTSLVHVDDCCTAIGHIVTQPHPNRRIYFVEDGKPRTIDELADDVSNAVQRKPLVLRAPRFLLLAAAVISELVGRLRRRAVALTRDKVQDLSQPYWVCDATPLRTELGWSPTITFPDGARATAEWYREHGWL